MPWIQTCAALLVLLAGLTACGKSAPLPQEPATVSSAAEVSAPRPVETLVPPPQIEQPEPLENSYLQQEIDQLAATLKKTDGDAFKQVQAAYRYLIDHTVFGDPVGLDVWRYRGELPRNQPPYLENRALSPVLFGIGSCEDYAAALTLLLRRMGFEAVYLPGLTISVDGVFVDHAWTMVRIKENWYHLDCQLEDNVMRGGQLNYRYFLKTDQEMLADHRWGENWIAYGGLTEDQQQEVRDTAPPAPCETPYPPPPPEQLGQKPSPNRMELLLELEQEKAAFEAEYGVLPPLELDILPPIFGK